MQTFQYKAVTKDGKSESGTIDAANEYEAVSRLKMSYPVVEKISPVQLGDGRAINRKISEKALAVMCSQFSIILGAGLPIIRAVELIANQTADKTLKKILRQSAQDVAAGYGLAQSLKSRGPGLPAAFIETVRSGEESGTLDVSFRRLHSYYDKSYKMKGKVKAAMIYPMFTLIVAVIVIVIIMVVAVPAFTNSFSSMGVELPAITKALISMSGFFTKYWGILAVIVVAALVVRQIYVQTPNGAQVNARQRLKLPVLGKINRMKVSAQFANTLSTLLAAGLPMLRAVSVTAAMLDNAWIAAVLMKQLPGLESGKELGTCLRAADILPELLCEMVGVGEETGTLEHTLDVVGAYYDNETDMASQKALSLLEPIIICLLAVVVAFVLLSVYLPMFTLYDSIG